VNAALVVDILLEQEDRADSDPKQRPAFPRGFTATNGTDVLEVRYSPRPYDEYRMVKRWADDYTGKPREFEGHYCRASTPERMQAHFEKKAAALTALGWTVELLGP